MNLEESRWRDEALDALSGALKISERLAKDNQGLKKALLALSECFMETVALDSEYIVISRESTPDQYLKFLQARSQILDRATGIVKSIADTK